MGSAAEGTQEVQPSILVQTAQDSWLKKVPSGQLHFPSTGVDSHPDLQASHMALPLPASYLQVKQEISHFWQTLLASR